LGGDLVHGCIKSSKFTFSAETRIGLGAAIFFSWLSVRSVLETGGGVLSRGTPMINKELISKLVWLQTKGIVEIYTFAIQYHF